MNTATETPQPMQALAIANQTRSGHAALKRELRGGMLNLEEALTDPRARGKLTIGQLLRARRGYGERRVRSYLGRLGIAESRRVEQLTERQRQMVVGGMSARTSGFDVLP